MFYSFLSNSKVFFVHFYADKVSLSIYTCYTGATATHCIVENCFTLVGVGFDQVL